MSGLLIMFDCDGTLSDSHGYIVEALQRAWRQHNFSETPPDEAIRSIIGLELTEAIMRLSPQLSDQQARAIARSYMECANSRTQEPLLFGGIRAVIETLHRDGHLLGIATGMGRRNLLRFLQNHELESYFVTLKTADDGPGKPHPEILRQAMEETAMAPERTIMIGDSLFDIALAIAAGAHPIGVAWGYEKTHKLLDGGAKKVAHEAGELIALCRSFTP